MEILKERILQDGRALSETVLKVDSFLNHGVDARLMYEIGTYFAAVYEIKCSQRFLPRQWLVC